jgi:hypothetical protein
MTPNEIRALAGLPPIETPAPWSTLLLKPT